MYVRSLFLDRFGRRANLRVDHLSEGLNILYGAPGSGKTTLVDFLFAMWHGFDSRIRERYLPPESRGFGGMVVMQTPLGRQAVSRYDDGGSEGRLTVEREDGAVIGRRHVHDLFGEISPDLLKRAFIVDFQRRPRLEELLDAATAGDYPVRDRPTLAGRLEEVERNLAQKQSSLAQVAVPRDALDTLRQRHRDLFRQLERVTAASQSELDEPTLRRQRLREAISELEQRQSALRSELAELDRKRDELEGRRRRLHGSVELKRPAENLGNQLQAFDVQLGRWKRTLRDLVRRRQRLAERANHAPGGNPLATASNAAPRRRLANLEARILELQQLLEQIAGRDRNPTCSELQSAFTRPFQAMRDELYQLCNDLSAWQSNDRYRKVQQERDQLSRCEQELRQSIRALSKRRNALLHRIASTNPAVAVHPEHGLFCRCEEHPQPEYWAPQRNESGSGLPAELLDVHAEIERIGELVRGKRLEFELRTAELVERRSELSGLANPSVKLDADIENLRTAVAQVEQDLRDAELRQTLTQEILLLEDERRTLRDESRSSRLVREAAEYLRSLSSSDWVAIQAVSSRDVWIESSQGRRVAYSELDAGGRDQVYLAFCMAVVAACDGDGVRIPLVLNGAFENFPSKHVPDALATLRDFGRARQVLCLTRHEHLVSVAKILNVPVHTLDSQVATGVRSPEGSELRQFGSAADQRTAGTLNRPAEADAVSPISMGSEPDRTDAEYHLDEHDLIERSPSIDETTAAKLRSVHIVRVGDLLRVPAAEIAEELRSAGLSTEMIQSWQAQARLMCRVPGLGSYDARILVACGITDSEQLLRMSPVALRARVKEFAASAEGRAILLSGTESELSRVSDWIQYPVERHQPPQGPPVPEQAAAEQPELQDASRVARKRRNRNAPGVLSLHDGDKQPRFHLERTSPVVDAPSIGPSLAKRLERIGIVSVADLLSGDAAAIAGRLQMNRITAEIVRGWQRQTEFVCRVPQLRGHDAQILVAAGIPDVEALAAMSPGDLWRRIQPYCESLEGKRMLRQGCEPTAEEVADWIQWSRQARTLNAA